MHRRFLLAALPCLAATPARAAYAVPDAAAARSLAQATMATFAEAVNKDDFALLTATGARPFQKQVTPAALRKSFELFLTDHVDLTAIAATDPVFEPPPRIDRAGLLTLAGRFEDADDTWFFSFRYINEDGAWKLVGIFVDSDPL